MAATKVLPAINVKGMPGFLLWARRDSPALYAAMVNKFPAVGLFESKLREEADPGELTRLGDFSDVLSSIGDTISSTAGDIASWVGDNAAGILKAGASVAVAFKGAQVAQTQLQLATMNKAPARMAYNAQGQLVPVQPVGTNLYTGTVPQSFMSAPTLGVPTWVWIAGGAGVLALVLLTRR